MEYSNQSQGTTLEVENEIMERSEKSDQLAINTIRFLSADAVQKANSGHPGAPMGMAPMAYTLWDRYLKHNPANPNWFNRDRFILSAGHASMLLYSLLHLTGYDLSLEDIKNFRQWESKTPGHPEYSLTPGVEITSGPLGQGFAAGIGIALAEKFLSSRFNKPEHQIVNHFTYAIVSDGDLQEGVSYEAASFAGHFGLGKLIYLYDDNNIQIEGSTDLTFSDDVKKRFEAVNWHVVGPVDGNDINSVEDALKQARLEEDKPSLIICKTNIAFGSPNKQNTASAHGEPLGIDEIIATKDHLDWPQEPDFYIPEEVSVFKERALQRGKLFEESWNKLMASYKEKYPENYSELSRYINDELPKDWDIDLDNLFDDQKKSLATRAASGIILNSFADKVQNIMGGSADLGPSNKTEIKTEGDFSKENGGNRNIHFGVREHTMAAVANGMALHGGMIPYTGTFLVFSDYMKPSMRLAALMGLRIIYIFSHDSIGLGEDGPTHQPIEHLMSLRAIPNLTVFRSADANETIQGWRYAVNNHSGPTALVLTRQKLPVMEPAPDSIKGAYIKWQSDKNPRAIIIASGSEVSIAIEAAERLKSENINVRVVSMPSWEIFDQQPKEYRDQILPPTILKRVAVEAGYTDGWQKYVGLDGEIIGMNSFGASAPSPVLFEKFDITADNIVKSVKGMI